MTTSRRLQDKDSTATSGTPETITLTATDSFGNSSASPAQTIDVTVAGLPSIAVTTPTQTIGVDQTHAITGVSLSESGNTTGETFTVTLSDTIRRAVDDRYRRHGVRPRDYPDHQRHAEPGE